MKKYLVIIGVMVLATMMFAQVGSAEDKLGYVEMKVIFDEYQKTIDADEQMKALAEAKQSEREAVVTNIRRMKDEMTVLADSSEEKVAKQTEIDEMIKNLQSFDQQSRVELQNVRDQKVQAIFDDINSVVAAYGKSKGYAFIFADTAMIYKRDKGNVTNDVLAELNKGYKKE